MQQTDPRSFSYSRLVLVGGALALSSLSCGREPTSPGASAGVVRSQGIAFATEFPAAYPQFQAAGGSGVAFTKVRIVLNHLDGTVALDTVVIFPAGATEVQITLSVLLPASTPATGLPLSLNLKYVNAAGDTVFRGGPVTVAAVPVTPGSGPPPPSPVTIPISYTGPGANAASVRIIPKALTVNTGGTFSFSAQALDASGTVLPNTPIVFASQDLVLASINAATGAGLAGSVRGTASIVAQLLTGPTDAAVLTIVSPPAAIVAVSGSGQTGPANATLPQPVVVQVNAADGLPAPGVAVAFVAQNGGTTGAASATTDANGRAQTTWKLGATAGAQTATASAAGLTGSPVTFNATARSIDPVRLTITTQPPPSTGAGAAFGIVVTAVDGTGTLTPGFTGPVTVALGGGAPVSAVLTGTATMNAVAGVATFNDLQLNIAGGYTLLATTSGLTGATSNAFQIVPGAASKLVFQNYPIVGAVAGATMDNITVHVRDALGNAVTSFTGAVTLTANGPAALVADSAARGAESAASAARAAAAGAAKAVSPPANALIGTTTVNAVAGVATFTGIKITTAGSYTFGASAAGITTAIGPPFLITPGPASNLRLFSGGGQSAAGTAALPSPIVVQVTDGFLNGVGGVMVSFLPATGNGFVNPPSVVSDAGGFAQTSWTLLGVAGAKTLNVSGSGILPNPLVVTATATTSSGTARIWTGATSTAWDVATNWSPAGIPGPFDPLTIPVTGTAPAITVPVLATAGSLTILPSATLTNGSQITITGALNNAGTIAGLGAVVLSGGSGTVSGTMSGDLSVTSGTYNVAAPLVITGSLTMGSGGRLDVGAQSVTVNGPLFTTSDGRLVMTNPAGTVTVTGNASFAGGSENGFLTAGRLDVLGDFATTGASFGATGTHVLRMTGTVAGTPQTLTYSAPIAGQGINTLVFTGARGKVVSGTVEVIGTVYIATSSDTVSGPGATATLGNGFVDSTAFLDLLGGWRVATTKMFGGTISATAMKTNLTVKAGTVRMGLIDTRIIGNVSVDGFTAMLDLNGSEVEIFGNFQTVSGGRLKMVNFADDLTVTGNVLFAGGSTAGLLTNGDFRFFGNFSQSGGAPDAFAGDSVFDGYPGNVEWRFPEPPPTALARATRTHSVRAPAGARGNAGAHRHSAVSAFLRSASAIAPASVVQPQPTIYFANPGYGPGTSHFGTFEPKDTVTLLSDVYATGMLEDEGVTVGLLDERCCLLIQGADKTLTTRGAELFNMRFEGVRWVLEDGDAVPWIHDIFFGGMNPAVTQFEVRRTGAVPLPIFYNWTFETVPTTGLYVKAVDTDGLTPVLTLYMSSATPATDGGKTATAGGAVIYWPTNFTWTGAVSTDWYLGTNWSTGVQPSTLDDIVIPAAAPRMPAIASLNAYARSITIQSGASITTAFGATLWVYGDIVAPLTSTAVICGTGGGTLRLAGTGAVHSVVGKFCNAYVAGTYKVADGGNQVVLEAGMFVDGIGTFNVNGGRLDIGGVGGTGPGALYTQASGTLIMTNPLDQLFVGGGGAWFQGGSTTGLLTAGTITLVSNSTQSSSIQSSIRADAYAPSGTHKVVFTDPSGTHPALVTFTDPTQSFLNDADITAGTGILLGSDVHVNGNLSRAGTGTAMIGSTTGTTHTLTANGLNFSSAGATMMSNVSLVLTGSNGAVFDNVTWSAFPLLFAGDVFVVNRSGAALTFNSHNFTAVTLSLGHWLRNSGTANVHMATPTPSSVTTQILRDLSAGTITWP